MGRARPGRMGSGGVRGAARVCGGRAGPDGRRGDRAHRPDARRDAARRRRPAGASGHHLVRPADRPATARDRGRHRRGRSGRAHRESAARRLHRAETALGPRARAEVLRLDPTGAAAQGLHPLSTVGPGRDGRGRRVGHGAVRREAAPLVRGHAAGPGGAGGVAADRLRVADAGGGAERGAGRTTAVARRCAPCGRRGRSGRRWRGRGRHRARRRAGHDRLVGRRVRSRRPPAC